MTTPVPIASSSSSMLRVAWEKQPAERRKEGMRVEGCRREREREMDPVSVNLTALSAVQGKREEEGVEWRRKGERRERERARKVSDQPQHHAI